MPSRLTRRSLIAASSGVAISTAGCLGIFNQDTNADDPAYTKQDSDDGETTSSTTSQQTSESGGIAGEEVVEQYLAENGFAWMQLNDPSEQFADTHHADVLSDLADAFNF